MAPRSTQRACRNYFLAARPMDNGAKAHAACLSELLSSRPDLWTMAPRPTQHACRSYFLATQTYGEWRQGPRSMPVGTTFQPARSMDNGAKARAAYPSELLSSRPYPWTMAPRPTQHACRNYFLAGQTYGQWRQGPRSMPVGTTFKPARPMDNGAKAHAGYLSELLSSRPDPRTMASRPAQHACRN